MSHRHCHCYKPSSHRVLTAVTLCWPDLQWLSLIVFSNSTGSSVHQLTSSTEACWHIYFTPSSTGWMFLSVSSSSSEWLFVDVCRATLLSTSSTAASLRPTLLVTSSSALQVDLTSPSHQFHRLSGVFYCRRDSLELTARLSTWYVA